MFPGQAGWLGSLAPDHAAIIAEAHAREGGRCPSDGGSGGQLSAASGSTTTGSGVFLAPPSSLPDGNDDDQQDAAALLDPSQFTAEHFGFFSDGVGGDGDTVREFFPVIPFLS